MLKQVVLTLVGAALAAMGSRASAQPCAVWNSLRFPGGTNAAQQSTAYHPGLGGVVYLTRDGGLSTSLSRLWLRDADGVRLLATGGPPAIEGTPIGYDPVNDCIWAVTPPCCGGPSQSQVWKWNASGWQMVAQDVLPAQPFSPLGFDPLAGKMLLCIGTLARYWDGTSASVAPTLPSVSYYGSLVFDPATQAMMVAGCSSGIFGYERRMVLAPDAGWTEQFNYLIDVNPPIACAMDTERGVLVGWVSNYSLTVEWDASKGVWRRMLGSTWSPGGSSPIAFDPVRGVTVAWTGDDRETTWDGIGWTAPTLAQPDVVADGVFVWDQARGVAVAFGGLSRDPGTSQLIRLGDTWEYHAGSWTRLQGSGPSARERAAAVFDAVRNRLVLFGGFDGSRLADTWEYSQGVWVEREVSGPSARLGHAMAFDPVRGMTVLFGGFDGSLDGETWEYDGVNWVLRSEFGPSPRQHAAMVFDPARGAVVLHGGATASGFSGETWSWDGSDWTLIATGGPDLSRHGMAYDADRSRMVMHGGRSNAWGSPNNFVWEWSGSSWSVNSWGTVSSVASHGFVYDTADSRFLRLGGNAATAGQPLNLSKDLYSLRVTGPRITGQPLGQTVEFGAAFSASVVASTIGTPTFQWRRDGVNLADNGRVSGSTGPALTVTGVAPADAGVYDVVVTDNCGAVASDPAILDVECPPIVFTQQPQSQSVVVGGTVSLSGGASGIAPLAYQWLRDGTIIVDGGRFSGAASATLTIAHLQFDDAGEYALTVADACGMTTSESVGVAVLCRADWNRDGIVNSTDVAAFINDWFTDIAAGTLVTDLSGNGVVNSTDVALFVDEFFATPAACL